MLKISFSVDEKSINEAIRQIEDYKKAFATKVDQFTERLAQVGALKAYEIMQPHQFTRETLASLKVTRVAPGQYILSAASEALLFFEFGTGIKYSGTRHPLASKFGYGPGTFKGKGHWADPDGWWFETSDERLIRRHSLSTGKTYGHTKGQPPRMPMYLASRDIIQQYERIAKEVFGS